ncbi:MAG: purine-binding chemotaxis protein CheW, partial [Polaromonas sp.]|nr:purine-binding chemotaxis protein CheW [Gemmatimonadaceae bacterium]
MTKRRLRYSELAAPAVPAPPAPAAPTAPVTPRKPRNSTPVELARALAAAQAAERVASGQAPVAPPVVTQPRTPYRSMRDRARAREGIVDLLMFRIGGERFGVELLTVDEVIDLPVIHHVPEMPPAMLGVVTVRGSLTPVYSPHHALGLPLALRDAVLIFRRGGVRVGILIDDVDDAITIDLAELRETPGADQVDSIVLGVMRHAGAIVGLVEADALLAPRQTGGLVEVGWGPCR